MSDSCPCGHPAADHALLDHDRNGDGSYRRELGFARYHWICQADVHPDGMADSPWDHVCGCLVNVYEAEPGVPTINAGTDPQVVAFVREALREEAAA